ncbi:MAG: 5-formyltetrahydrofolate cyclo-ligase [Rudaea sp.]
MNPQSPDPLRTRLREARVQLTPTQRIAAASAIVEQLEQLPEFLVDERVAGYWAVAGELPLHAAVARLRARGQRYHLPVIAKGRYLRFAPLLANATLRTNRYGIPEPQCVESELLAPSAIELVLVPLIAFDRRGHRLGSGGGYYDRSFAFLREAARPASPLLVGIGYSFQELRALERKTWDVPMDYIATERELIDCTLARTSP